MNNKAAGLEVSLIEFQIEAGVLFWIENKLNFWWTFQLNFWWKFDGFYMRKNRDACNALDGKSRNHLMPVFGEKFGDINLHIT